MPVTFGVVDLFAGPGGLGEGFSSVFETGDNPFRIGISVEKEASAHRTLTLRAFIRDYSLRHGALPSAFRDLHAGRITDADWSAVDAEAWRKATAEARCLELGSGAAGDAIDATIRRMHRGFDDTILIGGPPCQAYSLVGRARSRGNRAYVPEKDERHYLFREYIRVLDRLRPAAFVMENVKGMLSSTVDSRLVFELLMEDLRSVGTGRGHHYELRAIRVEDGVAALRGPAQPSDFVVRAERFGIPQRRHRVIIVGIRQDVVASADRATLDVPAGATSVKDAIGNLPALRSGISRGGDDDAAWRKTVTGAAQRLTARYGRKGDLDLADAFRRVVAGIAASAPLPRDSTAPPRGYGRRRSGLLQWLESSEVGSISQHETRAHMASDLERYLFASVFGVTHGYSPKAEEFPSTLRPAHDNWGTGIFSDRFRVQLAHGPSTTITSHISKDGHYFIHPDPLQCRTLTVREAARLQTFPDDYLFLGNRTQQYVQVGNAVPPLLARHIAALLSRALSGPQSIGGSGGAVTIGA